MWWFPEGAHRASITRVSWTCLNLSGVVHACVVERAAARRARKSGNLLRDDVTDNHAMFCVCHCVNGVLNRGAKCVRCTGNSVR